MPVTGTAPEATPHAVSDDRRLQALEQVRDLDRRVENDRLIRDAWTLIIFAIAAVALLAAIIAVGFGMRAIDEAERHAAALAAAGASLS
ncbi:MAG TPA: hypothetical protein VFA83_13065 [Acidimicrobiales bacterium]|nr:hypothetical protein [Acidimicrobiales bacterium]